MVQSLNQPLNYMLNVPDPSQAVTAGLQQGVQLASMMERTDALAAQKQQTQVETQLMQAKAQREQAQRDAIAAYYDTPPEKRTTAMFERIQATAPKEVAENMRASFDALTKEQQRQKLLTGAQVFSALRSGDRETANTILRQQADAARNAGDNAGAKAFENAAEMAAIAPDQAELFVGTSLAALPGGKEFLENVGKQQEQRFEAQLQPSKLSKAQSDALKSKFDADIAGVKAEFASEQERAELNVKKASSSNMYSQITDRAKRLGLDERKFADESARAWTNLGLDRARLSQLPEPIRKEIDTYVVKAGEASTDAARMREIARRYREEVTTGGLQASAGELYARLTGKTDAISDLRAEYARMRNTQVLKNLPPGPASDKDIAFAAKGFPDENANPQQVSAFLTGFAKIRELEAKQNEARAAWTSTFRGLSNATTEASVGGVQVQAGEKFNDFVKRYQGGETPAAPAGRAPAAAPAADVRAQADAILRGGK